MQDPAGEPEPAIRTSWAKLAISVAKRMPDPERARILDALAPQRNELREASVLEWRPAEMFVAVTEAVEVAVGPQGGRNFWCDVMMAAFDRRVLHPFVRGSLLIHGRTPGSILRMTPKAYLVSFRNCGTSHLYETDARNRVRMQFDGLPPVMWQSDSAMRCFAGNCDASIKYLKLTGTATRHDDDLQRGRLHFIVEWDE